MIYLLDTDTCVTLLRGREPVLTRVRSESPDDLAIASMSEAELRFGALKSSSPKAALARIDAFLSAPIAVLPFEHRAAHHHAHTRFALRSQPIGDRDLVIASVALAHGLTLVSGNTREFRRVPGLMVEDWGR